MRGSLAITALTIVITIVCLPGDAATRKQKQRRIVKGDWGGQSIRVNVSDSSAKVEYDCAHGEINGPLMIDRRGRFSLKGTHYPEHGGPVRIDEQSNGEPARYSGWTDGKRMTLTVTIIGSG